MLVTLLGMLIDVSPEQLKKADEPMLVTLLGITVFLQPKIKVLEDVSIMALQLFLLSYTELFAST